MNKWLDPVVDSYRKYFGLSGHPTVWDVGSRDGRDGFELMKRISSDLRAELNSKLVLIEPNPTQAEKIAETYPKATVYQLAIADRPGIEKFKVYHGNEGDVGSSSLHMDWKKGSGLRSHIIEVQVVRLDELVDKETIDIMKIDVEGYGYQALLGLGEKLDQVRVLHIETEHESKSDVKVKAYLEKRGWIITDITEQWGGMPDITAVNANPVSLKQGQESPYDQVDWPSANDNR